MAKSELERTVQQSLLERLTDDAPYERRDAPATWAQSVRQLKASVHRDLEWLLNTRSTAEPVPEELQELRRSVYNYGLPDITSLSRDSGQSRGRLLRLVEEAINTFEPRLTNVRVRMAEADTPIRRQLHFVIEAMLRMDPNPEPVVFDTTLDVSSGQYRLQGAAGA